MDPKTASQDRNPIQPVAAIEENPATPTATPSLRNVATRRAAEVAEHIAQTRPLLV